MLSYLVKCLVLLSPLACTSTQAFWWRGTTTEAPPEPLMKQIPLTYFRTYTYQPMAGNPLPFPLMSSTDYVSNYAALANNPLFNPMMSVAPAPPPPGVPVPGAEVAVSANEIPIGGVGPMGYRPPKSYTVIRSMNNGYLTPPTVGTTTSTTTTTTPEPTTTTTTTTTTTPAPTTTTTAAVTAADIAESQSNESAAAFAATASVKTDAMVNIEAAYPAFNRKVYTNHFNINYNRPVYPYPEYSVYKPPAAMDDISAPPTASASNVEFVPCMCPVNMQGGFPSGIPIVGNPGNSIFLAQGRTNPDIEADMHLTATATAVNVGATQSEVPLADYMDDLQLVSLDEAAGDGASSKGEAS